MIFLIALLITAPVDSVKIDSLTIPPVKSIAVSDNWFSADKFLHLGVSTGMVGLTYHTWVCRLNRDEDEGRILSISLTAVVGLSKEIYDRIKKGHFSWKDLVYDGLGLASGYFLFVY